MSSSLSRRVGHSTSGRITDIEMYGRTIPAGAKVLLLIGSANRDSEAFPDGDTFRIDRPEKGALASFGAGVHFCLGAHIQLTEVQPEARVRSAAERSLS